MPNNIEIRVQVSGADEANKVLQGLATSGAKFSSVTTAGAQEAAKSMSGLGESFRRVGEIATGVSFGNLFADGIRAVKDFTVEVVKLGQEARVQEEAFRLVAESVGASSSALNAAMASTADGLANQSDVMLAQARALQQGLNPQQLVSFMEIAKSQALLTGKTVTEAFNEITNAITVQQTRALKNMGITVDSAKAYDDYAKSLGTVAGALTEAGRSQALAIAVQEQMKGKLLDANTAILQQERQLQRWRVEWDETKEQIGKNMIELTLGIVNGVHGIWNALTDNSWVSAAKDMYNGFFDWLEKRTGLAAVNADELAKKVNRGIGGNLPSGAVPAGPSAEPLGPPSPTALSRAPVEMVDRVKAMQAQLPVVLALIKQEETAHLNSLALVSAATKDAFARNVVSEREAVEADVALIELRKNRQLAALDAVIKATRAAGADDPAKKAQLIALETERGTIEEQAAEKVLAAKTRVFQLDQAYEQWRLVAAAQRQSDEQASADRILAARQQLTANLIQLTGSEEDAAIARIDAEQDAKIAALGDIEEAERRSAGIVQAILDESAAKRVAAHNAAIDKVTAAESQWIARFESDTQSAAAAFAQNWQTMAGNAIAALQAMGQATPAAIGAALDAIAAKASGLADAQQQLAALTATMGDASDEAQANALAFARFGMSLDALATVAPAVAAALRQLPAVMRETRAVQLDKDLAAIATAGKLLGTEFDATSAEIQRLRQEFDALNRSGKGTQTQLEALAGRIKALTDQQLSDTFKQIDAAAAALGPAFDATGARIQVLRQRFDDLNRATKGTAAELPALGAELQALMNQQKVEQWIASLTDGFDQMLTLAKSTASAMQTAFSDLFFDVFTGQLKSAGDLFKNFLNSMLRAVSNFLASQLVGKLFEIGLSLVGGASGITRAAPAAAAAGGAPSAVEPRALMQSRAYTGFVGEPAEPQPQTTSSSSGFSITQLPIGALNPSIWAGLGSVLSNTLSAFNVSLGVGNSFLAAAGDALSTFTSQIGGAVSALTPFTGVLAAVATAMNVYSGIMDLIHGNTVRGALTLGGTAVGAIGGAVVGTAIGFPVIGTLVGAALGGALGSLFGGLFKPKLSHEQREAIEFGRTAENIRPLVDALGDHTRTMEQLFDELVAYSSKSSGGTHEQQTNFYVGGHLIAAPGSYYAQTQAGAITSPEQLAAALAANPEGIKAFVQQGIAQPMLDQLNAAIESAAGASVDLINAMAKVQDEVFPKIRQQIVEALPSDILRPAALKALDALQAQFAAAINSGMTNAELKTALEGMQARFDIIGDWVQKASVIPQIERVTQDVLPAGPVADAAKQALDTIQQQFADALNSDMTNDELKAALDALQAKLETYAHYVQLLAQLQSDEAQLSGNIAEQTRVGILTIKETLAQLDQNIESAQAALDAAAGPDQQIAAASALRDAILARYTTEKQMIQQIEQQIAGLLQNFGTHLVQVQATLAATQIQSGNMAGFNDLMKSLQASALYAMSASERLWAVAAGLQALGVALTAMMAATNQGMGGGTMAGTIGDILPKFFGAAQPFLDALVGIAGVQIKAGDLQGALQTLQQLDQAATNVANQALAAVEAWRQASINAINAALQSDIDAINTAHDAQVKAIQDAAAAQVAALQGQIEGIQAAAKAQQDAIATQIEGLQAEQEAAQEAAQAQQEANQARIDALSAELSALQEQAQAARAWQEAADNLRTFLINLRMGPQAPINPADQLRMAQERLAQLLAQFQAAPSPDLIGPIQDMAQQVLAFGATVYTKPSPEYQALFASVTASLDSLGAEAQAHIPVGVADIEAQTKAIQDEIDRLRQENTEIGKAAQAVQKAIQQQIAGLQKQSQDIGTAAQQTVAGIQAQIQATQKGAQDAIAADNANRAAQIAAAQASARDQIAAVNKVAGDLSQGIRNWLEGILTGSAAAQQGAMTALLGSQNAQLFQITSGAYSQAYIAGQALATNQHLIDLGTILATGFGQFIGGPNGTTAQTAAVAYHTATLQAMFPSGISYLGDRLDWIHADTSAMAGRGYQHGTLSVPATGAYMLHEGEAVLPRSTAEGLRDGSLVSTWDSDELSIRSTTGAGDLMTSTSSTPDITINITVNGVGQEAGELATTIGKETRRVLADLVRYGTVGVAIRERPS